MPGDEIPDEKAPRRHYDYSGAPILADSTSTSPLQAGHSGGQAVLLAMYSEICGNWRLLTDVRFRLLGLVPPVAGLALVAVVSSGGPLAGVNDVVRVAGAVFGLLITTSLYIYDRRNDEPYNDLTSRGRRAEHELGIHTGVFLGRLDVKTRFENKSLIRHGVATGLIYWTVMISWVGAIVYVMAYRP